MRIQALQKYRRVCGPAEYSTGDKTPCCRERNAPGAVVELDARSLRSNDGEQFVFREFGCCIGKNNDAAKFPAARQQHVCVLPGRRPRHDDQILHAKALLCEQRTDLAAQGFILDWPRGSAPKFSAHQRKPPAPEKPREIEHPDEEPPIGTGHFAQYEQERCCGERSCQAGG